MIVEKVNEYRRDNPGLGCAKLYLIVRRLFCESGGMPGRDAFIELLRRNGLMVRLKRRRHYRTTDSRHHYRKYPNLITDIIPSRPNEIWVSDITYVETGEGVCYLSLVTDAYSHKIVGWSVGPTLETTYPLEALRMALSTIDDTSSGMLIHHSDRGCHPLENAVAERANGILKVEWLYKMTIATRTECKSVLERIIDFYNTQRPHMSIGMQTPDEAHKQCGEQKRCWKKGCAMG